MVNLKWLSALALAAVLNPASAATIGAISVFVNDDNVLNYDFTYIPALNEFSDTRNQVLGGVNGNVSFNLESTGDADDPLVFQNGVITNLSTVEHTYRIGVGIPLGTAPDPDSTVLGPFTRGISSITGILTDGGDDGATTAALIRGFSDLVPPGPSVNVDALALCTALAGESAACEAGTVTDFPPTLFDNLSFELQFSLAPGDTFSYETFVQLSHIPEPYTFLLLSAGFGGLVFNRRLRQ
jgi:hypothetical protein